MCHRVDPEGVLLLVAPDAGRTGYYRDDFAKRVGPRYDPVQYLNNSGEDEVALWMEEKRTEQAK
jgi:hypothetical protein